MNPSPETKTKSIWILLSALTAIMSATDKLHNDYVYIVIIQLYFTIYIPRMSLKQLGIGAAGIYAAYLTGAILAERLYSKQYPSTVDENKTDAFNYPSLIVWFGSLLCAIFGYFRGKATHEQPNPISKKQQIILGLLYTFNILTANYALLYISYLNQTIGRNCRYLMVVIVGAFFSRVKKGSSLKLQPKKVITATVITVGVLMFTILKTGNKTQSHLDPSQQWKGILLLLISVVSDALFSDSQAYSKSMFKPTANHLFTSANFLTFVFVALFSVAKGQFLQQIMFCVHHPSAVIDILGMSILQVVGQVSIYYVIANFKQHIFPLISTTRKVLTVLLSIFIYKHSVNWMQWVSIFMVFGGLVYELNEEIKAKKAKQLAKQKQKQN